MLGLAAVVLVVWAIWMLQTTINLLSFKRLPTEAPPGSPDDWPFVSIVIPARNEERAIGETLEKSLQQDYPRFEVVVVDDGSTDGTALEIEKRVGDSRLRAVTGAPLPPGWLGKPHALAQGAAAARGEFFLFMDADVRLAPRALRDSVAFVERRRLDHLSLFPHFERVGFWEEVLMPVIAQTALIYFPSFLARSPRFLRAALGGGAFSLIRRAAYYASGGHEKIKNSVVDDVRLAMELKRAGFSSLMEKGDHLVSLRMYHGRAEFVRGFTKNLHAVIDITVRGRWVFGAVFLILGQALHLVPFLGLLAPPPARFVSMASLALLLLSRSVVQWWLSYPLWPVLFHPLQVAVMADVECRSLLMAYREGVVRWRDREYRRDGTTF